MDGQWRPASHTHAPECSRRGVVTALKRMSATPPVCATRRAPCMPWRLLLCQCCLSPGSTARQQNPTGPRQDPDIPTGPLDSTDTRQLDRTRQPWDRSRQQRCARPVRTRQLSRLDSSTARQPRQTPTTRQPGLTQGSPVSIVSLTVLMWLPQKSF